MSEPIGWVLLREDGSPLRTGGDRSTSKLYSSYGSARAAYKLSSYPDTVRVVPVFVDK